MNENLFDFPEASHVPQESKTGEVHRTHRKPKTTRRWYWIHPKRSRFAHVRKYRPEESASKCLSLVNAVVSQTPIWTPVKMIVHLKWAVLLNAFPGYGRSQRVSNALHRFVWSSLLVQEGGESLILNQRLTAYGEHDTALTDTCGKVMYRTSWIFSLIQSVNELLQSITGFRWFTRSSDHIISTL